MIRREFDHVSIFERVRPIDSKSRRLDRNRCSQRILTSVHLEYYRGTLLLHTRVAGDFAAEVADVTSAAKTGR